MTGHRSGSVCLCDCRKSALSDVIVSVRPADGHPPQTKHKEVRNGYPVPPPGADVNASPGMQR